MSKFVTGMLLGVAVVASVIPAEVQTGSMASAQTVTLPLPTSLQTPTDTSVDERNLQRFLRETQQISGSTIRTAAMQELQSFAVVFVPGVLGSALESPTGGQIWPPNSLNFASLYLPAALLNETAVSDVKSSVLRKLLVMDMYGSALDKMRAGLKRVGITFIPCGYDWRRDIRAGAADLQTCLRGNHLLDPQRTVVFVAHSMGGLVTWTWHDLYYRQPSGPVPRVRGIAMLGSPIEGSCEMLRMIGEGYKQPTEVDKVVPKNFLTEAWAAWNGKWESIENNITSTLSNLSVRPAMFTWPGGFELLPPPTRDLTHACVTEAEPPLPESVPRPWYPLSDRFWTQDAPGWFVINMKQEPAEFPAVLAKAREFHAWFRQGDRAYLSVPLFVYRSLAWMTPTQMATANQRPAANGWGRLAGDGRVLGSSAELGTTAEKDPQGRFSVADIKATSFVHGALPEDPVVESSLLAERIPMIVNAHISVAIARRLTSSDAMLREFVRRAGRQATLDWHAVFTRLQYRAASIGALETEKDRAIVEAYNIALTTRGGLPKEEYIVAVAARVAPDQQRIAIQQQSIPTQKKLEALRGLAGSYQLAAARLKLVEESPKTSKEQVVFAEANRGLALTLANDYLTATSVLTDVEPRLAAVPETFDARDPGRITRLKAAVRANLGIALWETGQCSAAKPYLVQSLANEKAKTRYEGLCRDRATGMAVKLAD